MILREFFRGTSTLKQHFFVNEQFILNLLSSETSIRKQAEKFSEEINKKCSASTYMKYCKEFYSSYYIEHLNIVSINMNKSTIYNLYKNGEKNLGKIYVHLKEKGLLKKTKNDEKNIILYEDFKRLLRKDFERAEFKDIIYPDNVEEINCKAKIMKEAAPIERTIATVKENFKNDSNSLAVSKHIDKKQKIEIELLDGRIDNCPLVYLKNEVIMKNASNSAYDFNEKNYIVVPSIYKNNLIDFEFIKKSILQKEDVKNYSLIFHDNGKKDGNIYIYRLIDKELHVLKNFSSGHCMDFEIYYNNGIKNFLSIFKEQMGITI